MSRQWARFLAGLLILVIAFLPILGARAQNSDPEALNITTSPLPISLVAQPGETVKTELRVKNSGTKPETLKVGLMKFAAYGEEGKPELKDREPGDDYFDWVSFSTTQFSALPNEWKDLTMTITIPSSAAFGYYYAVTFQRANPKNPQDAQATAILGGSATLVLLDVQSPNARRELQLTGFSTSKRTYEFLPASFTIKLKNVGNVHAAPTGTIYISRGSEQIDTIKVNDGKGNILPSSGRIFTAEWMNGFPNYEDKVANGVVVQKNGQAEKVLSWKLSQLKNIRIGKYTAHLTMVYDDGQRDVPLDAQVDFWVIPWRALALIVGLPMLIVGIIIYLFISRWRYKNRATRFKR